MIQFTIPLEPKAQMRPKFASRGKFSVAYKDKKQVANEDNLLFYIDKYRPDRPFSGPVFMRIICLCKRPKSHFGAGKNSNKLKSTSPLWHTKKPDIDNFIKMLLDCMNGIFFEDDRQVCDIHVIKKYATQNPYWSIAIKELAA